MSPDPEQGSSSTEDPGTGLVESAPHRSAVSSDDNGGVDVAEVGSASDDATDARSLLSARVALGTFVAYLVVAFFLIVFRLGNWMWFISDDWGLIDGRDLFSLNGLFDAQNGHWSTVPFVVYQVLYRIFGLHTYLPYLAVTVVLHLTLAGLLRVAMRRSGVGPWTATVVAGTFVLFGTGYENILLAIQISMVGSMVFGMAQLLLADHDGPIDWRDGAGLGAGLLALMSSSIGIPMVVAVGVAVFIRRGWRPALFHTAPLAATYVLWLGWQRASGAFDAADTFSTDGLSMLGDWIADSVTGVFISLGGYPVVGIALAALLIGGLVLAWRPLDRSTFRRHAGVPLALLVGALVLVSMVGVQRAAMSSVQGGDLARSSRYMAIATALTLPALAVAAMAVIRRWRIAAPAVLALFLVGVPANIGAFDTSETLFNESTMTAQRRFVTGVASSRMAREVPPDTFIDPNELTTANLTSGFLVHADKIGRVPEAPELTDAELDRITVRLSMGQSLQGSTPPEPTTCTTHDEPLLVEAERGEQFVIRGSIDVAVVDGDDATRPITYSSAWAGTTLTSLVDGTFLITPVGSATTFPWCVVG